MNVVDLRRRRLIGAAGLAPIGASWPLATRAQSSPPWPSRPIRILVGFAPGGLTDAYARMYAEQLSARVGQPVTVENRPGAGALIALEALAKSPPDGHTLAVTTHGSVWQNRVLFRKLPFDAERDFTPVTLFPAGGLVMCVHTSVPARNAAEFIAWARTRPATMGSFAPASVPHMAAEVFNRRHGTKLEVVHYKGEAPMWIDVASGQVQVAIGTPLSLASVASRGTVRPIAATGRARATKMPEVPTFAEQGVQERLLELDGWLPLLAPAGTPEPILERLAAIALEGAATPRAAQLRESFGIPDGPVPLAEARQRWKDEAPPWIEVARSLGITLD